MIYRIKMKATKIIKEPEDSFAWAYRLQCPPSVCTEQVKKLLYKGIVGLLWDHAANKLYPVSEVQEARKNILLYKLEHEPINPAIQNIKNKMKLRAERDALQAQIAAAELQHEKQDFLLRQKRQQLMRMKSSQQSVQLKKELLLIKYSQMQTQIRDCEQMRQVCQRLMPSTSDTVEQSTIEACLSLVSSMASGGDRKQVFNKISESLYPVSMQVLWNALLQSRSSDIEKIIQLGAEVPLDAFSSKFGENLDIGIARVCGQHVGNVSKRLLHDARASNHQQEVVDYIEKIEMAQKGTIEIGEWLALTLEVRKLETELAGTQKEVAKIRETIVDRVELTSELSQMAANMQSIDIQIGQCAEDIQRSFALLKVAGSVLNNVREKFSVGLQKIAMLRAEQQDTSWLNIELSTELDEFYDNLDINALRKITLGGDVGAYRHARCCITQAPLLITALSDEEGLSVFPMIRAPIYYLLDVYKTLTKSNWFGNQEVKSPSSDIIRLKEWSPITAKNNVNVIMELLGLAESACEKTKEEIQEFNAIFEAWAKQTVQQAVMFDERTVDGVTFKEWQNRYNNVAYLIERPK